MTPPTPLPVSASDNGGVRLKSQCLSYLEVLAQSVSVIAPSTVPAAVLGLIFATAGNATWLSFLIGMLGLVLVSYNINQFARRSASAGSLYRFIVKGLGPTFGALSGWSLLFAYMLTGMSTLCGFVVTAKGLFDAWGYSVPSPLLSGAATLAICVLASRDAQLSAKAMLAFEGAALAAVLALGIVVWRWHGFSIDAAQLSLEGSTPGGVLSGVVLVVFAFSGFESSTALGEEAKDPLRSIPRSVLQSVVVSGIIFIFMAYVVILGYRDSGQDLAKAESPLFFLSQKLGVGWLGAFINFGIVISFFSCTLASVSATARIIYSMAHHRVAPSVLGAVHPRSLTPYVAAIFAAAVTYLVALTPSLFGVSDFDAQGYFGTLCSFGFLTVYLLISLAAPVYVRKRGELTLSVVVIALAAIVFMIVPFLGAIGLPGSTLFPLPAYPNNILIYIYLAYMVVGAAWLLYLRGTRPEVVEDVFEVTAITLSPAQATRESR